MYHIVWGVRRLLADKPFKQPTRFPLNLMRFPLNLMLSKILCLVTQFLDFLSRKMEEQAHYDEVVHRGLLPRFGHTQGGRERGTCRTRHKRGTAGWCNQRGHRGRGRGNFQNRDRKSVVFLSAATQIYKCSVPYVRRPSVTGFWPPSHFRISTKLGRCMHLRKSGVRALWSRSLGQGQGHQGR